MIQSHKETTLSDLYLVDETAWLEQMARLSANGVPSEMDLDHLSEYLTDMAKRDKREVVSRLVVLLVHLLKWEHQQDKRSRGWELTIKEQREELTDLVEGGVGAPLQRAGEVCDLQPLALGSRLGRIGVRGYGHLYRPRESA